MGGGVRLDGSQSRIISKGEFEVDSGLFLLKDDLDGHSVESIVKGIVRFPVVHIRFGKFTYGLEIHIRFGFTYGLEFTYGSHTDQILIYLLKTVIHRFHGTFLPASQN